MGLPCNGLFIREILIENGCAPCAGSNPSKGTSLDNVIHKSLACKMVPTDESWDYLLVSCSIHPRRVHESPTNPMAPLYIHPVIIMGPHWIVFRRGPSWRRSEISWKKN